MEGTLFTQLSQINGTPTGDPTNTVWLAPQTTPFIHRVDKKSERDCEASVRCLVNTNFKTITPLSCFPSYIYQQQDLIITTERYSECFPDGFYSLVDLSVYAQTMSWLRHTRAQHAEQAGMSPAPPPSNLARRSILRYGAAPKVTTNAAQLVSTMSRRLSEPCGDIGPNELVTSHSTVPPDQAWPYRIPAFPLKMPAITGGGPDADPTSSTLPDPSSNITSSAVDDIITIRSLGKARYALPLSMDFARYFTRPTEAIHASVCNGDLAQLRTLIATDRALVDLDSARGTPLEIAVQCANIDAARILLDAGAEPSRKGTRIESTKRLWGWRPVKAFETCRSLERCLCVAAAHSCGAIVFDYLNWTSLEWSGQVLETAWFTAISRWEANVVDLLHPLVPKDQATVEKALRRALAFKISLPEVERGRAKYKPADQLQQSRIVLRLLYAGGDANGLVHGGSGKPLLHQAISGTILQGGLHALLDGGANPEIQDRRGRTAFHFLASPISIDGQGHATHEEGIRLLLAKGAKATTIDTEGETPLQQAAMNEIPPSPPKTHTGRLSCTMRPLADSIVRSSFSLDSGLDINATSQSGWTPFLCALTPTFAGGYRKSPAAALQAALLLLSRGAITTTITAEGWTALHCIGSYPHLDANADAAVMASELVGLDGMPSIINACARGFDRLWLPRISKEARADLYGEEPWGFRVGKTLARCAATETAVVKDGMTPLHWAAERGAVGVAKVLLGAGADPNLRDSTGSTPRKLAAKSELLTRQDKIQTKMKELLEGDVQS
ncbi:ankyrin repeat-containing domain protein [Apiospora arundinis]